MAVAALPIAVSGLLLTVSAGALALNLDEVRHLGDFVDVAEDFADSPLVDLVHARVAWCVDRFGGHVLPCADCSPTKAGAQVNSGLCRKLMSERFFPLSLPNAWSPCANSGPVPERTGKALGARHRAARADMCWICPI